MVRRDVGVVRVDGARRKSATLEGAGVRGARRRRARRKSASWWERLGVVRVDGVRVEKAPRSKERACVVRVDGVRVEKAPAGRSGWRAWCASTACVAMWRPAEHSGPAEGS